MVEFKIGDKAVYPAQGVAKVVGIDTTQIVPASKMVSQITGFAEPSGSSTTIAEDAATGTAVQRSAGEMPRPYSLCSRGIVPPVAGDAALGGVICRPTVRPLPGAVISVAVSQRLDIPRLRWYHPSIFDNVPPLLRRAFVARRSWRLSRVGLHWPGVGPGLWENFFYD